MVQARSIAATAPRLIFTSIVQAYRFALSPVLVALFGSACRFEPSCSTYACDAVIEHGVVRGGYIALRRLLRCHPWGAHGYDPVPAAPRPRRSEA